MFMIYNIRYGNGKIAQFEHIQQAFVIDKTRNFQALRKIKSVYLHLENKNRLKMKVAYAARLFSNTVAAAMESMILARENPLPAIDDLFDSFNGRSPRPEMGKPFRRSMSVKSPHHSLWKELLPKINGFEFISRKNPQIIKKKQFPVSVVG